MLLTILWRREPTSLGNPAGSKTAQIGKQGGVQLGNSGGGQSGRDGKDGDGEIRKRKLRWIPYGKHGAQQWWQGGRGCGWPAQPQWWGRGWQGGVWDQRDWTWQGSGVGARPYQGQGNWNWDWRGGGGARVSGSS